MNRNGYDNALDAFQAAFTRVVKHLRVDMESPKWRMVRQTPEGRRLAALALNDLLIATVRLSEQNSNRRSASLRMRAHA